MSDRTFRTEVVKYICLMLKILQILGEPVRVDEYLFPMEMTETAFSDNSVINTPSSIFGNTIFIVIDPCGGGGRSRMGSMAAYYPPRAGNLVVFFFPMKTPFTLTYGRVVYTLPGIHPRVTGEPRKCTRTRVVVDMLGTDLRGTRFEPRIYRLE